MRGGGEEEGGRGLGLELEGLLAVLVWVWVLGLVGVEGGARGRALALAPKRH